MNGTNHPLRETVKSELINLEQVSLSKFVSFLLILDYILISNSLSWINDILQNV